MQFNSYLFILCFLPITVIAYYLFSRLSWKAGNIVLLLASACFYLYAGKKVSLLLAADILINYLFILLLRRTKDRPRKLWLFAGVTANVLLLLYLKYFDFFITNINTIFGTDLATRELLLPLGVSFFTFQQIGYLVDTYRGETEGNSFFDYLLFILFFPKIAMGPITSQGMLIPQFRDPERKRFRSDAFSRGIRMFTLGLAKKVLFAETFATAVSYARYYQLNGMATGGEILLIVIGYTFEIYFDFSGYTDMAQGVAGMLNIELAENFNSPYQALSIRDFWKRWHISLTSFLTKYLYIPLGGSRKGTARTYLNTMIVFLVSGFWHGANWTFVLWGALHGLFSVLERCFEGFVKKVPRVLRWLLTFVIVSLLWLLFQADSVASWLSALKILFTSGNFRLHELITPAFLTPEVNGIVALIGWATGASAATIASATEVLSVVMLLVFFGAAFLICLLAKNVSHRDYPNTRARMVFSALLLVFCILSLGSESTFVYNNF